MAVSAPTSPALLELRDLAREVAAEAGRLVLDHRPGALRFSTKSSDVDVVTEMDQAAQARILTALAQARPDDAVLGEEEGGRSGRTGITWVVDPIDGTTNYLYRLPFYAVSVAAVEGDPSVWGAWRPLAGAVVAPALGLAWGAARGQGAVRWSEHATERLQASACRDLPRALVGTGFSYDAQRRVAQASALAQVIGSIRDIRRLGSAALDLCLLAEGSLDGFFESCLNPWDLAAGWLIAVEAGARVGGPEASGPDSTLAWGCAPGLDPEFPALVLGAYRSSGII